MQENSRRDFRKNQQVNMNKRISVFINCTEKKYICLDSQATKEYTFISVGSSYKEALLDVNGDYNRMPDDFILLLVHAQPFYVKKEYLSRFDEEGDETRKVLCGALIFLN